MRKPISQLHPVFYYVSVNLRRIFRRLIWKFDSKKYAATYSKDLLKYRVKKHQSVLLRKLGDNMHLQHNKVVNLRLAQKELNNILILPGETFSFCKLVGLPTAKNGYLEGMELSFGEARSGIGGGICQLANLIHWLVLHSPLTIVERHHHSFDPFPDDGRVLPFGSGATIFYNYIDYQFTNLTPHIFQLNFWFTEKCIEGELRCSEELEYAYHVFEQNHAFVKIEDKYFRRNEIWRDKYLKFQGGKVVERICITKNFARVMYIPNEIEQIE